MTQYRRATLDLSTRLRLTLEMLAPCAVRGWGRATALAAEHQISRTRLYELRDCGQAALLAALAPQAPGPGPAVTTVTVIRRSSSGRLPSWRPSGARCAVFSWP